MKILHALVGYLALTAQPFHPFAFASVLSAIDYDGYVNKTHIDGAVMNHVLDTIVETCRSLAVTTTQNHTDTTVMKRVPGDVMEARQGGGIPIIIVGPVAVAFLLAAIVLTIAWILEDDSVRGDDVEFLVEHFD
jgi:hypothetical protein